MGADLLSEQEAHDLAQGWFAVLEALVRHAEQPGAGGRSPCDLPLLRLSQDEIERLESKYPQMEDMLPLSPLQEGLLFHALYDVHELDVYIVQLALALEGPLDGAALATAAQALVERHGSLRAGFEHENLSRPVQVIVAGVRPPWRSLDSRCLIEAGRAEQLCFFLCASMRNRRWTSTRCNWCSRWRGRSTGPRWQRRRRPLWNATGAWLSGRENLEPAGAGHRSWGEAALAQPRSLVA